MRTKCLLVLALLVGAQPTSAAGSEVSCTIGPVQRNFGGAIWNLYACDDSKSVVVVPVNATNNKAGYFFVTPDPEDKAKVVVVGEGWGDDQQFKPVFEELQQMSSTDLWLIISVARTTSKGN